MYADSFVGLVAEGRRDNLNSSMQLWPIHHSFIQIIFIHSVPLNGGEREESSSFGETFM